MARRPGWSRTFRKDSKLRQYFLDQVVPTGKTLGTGSYGSVLEVSGELVLILQTLFKDVILGVFISLIIIFSL